MRKIFLVGILFPSVAFASMWVELGKSPEVTVMFDKGSVQNVNGEIQAWVRFIYDKTQSGQTVTMGKPFDNTLNQFYLACKTKKYQVLQLILFNKHDKVGSFRNSLNRNEFQDAEPNSVVMYLMDKICAAESRNGLPEEGMPCAPGQGCAKDNEPLPASAPSAAAKN